MSRAVLLRLALGVAPVLIAALLLSKCGGNDPIDPADASADAAFERSPFDEASDAKLPDRQPDTQSEDSRMPDAAPDEAAFGDAEGGPPDAADAGDADARGTDASDSDGSNADANDADSGDTKTADAEAGVEGGYGNAPTLGAAKSFAVLASATITNTGVTTAVVGDVGISPGTALVGLTAGQVMGTIHLGDAVATKAEADLGTAYGDLAGRPCQHAMTSVDLGGTTLPPGVYCFAVAAAQSAGDLVLDGQGDPNAVWIFQIASTLTVAPNLSTTLINGGNACNVYWQVGSSATINGGAQFKGNILAHASISLLTGAKVSPGRTLAQTAAITLDSNVISNAGCP